MMKQIFIILTSAIILISCTSTENFSNKEKTKQQADNAHSSFNSLDWEGVYVGTEPCNDCKEIERRITLFENMHYEVVTEYIGSDKPLIMRHEGLFEWDNDGRSIALKNDDVNLGNLRYKVGENVLIPIDNDGKIVENGSKYTNPVRVQSSKLIGREWLLTELNGKVIGKGSEDGGRANLNFTNEGRVFGNSGCNNFSGEYMAEAGNELTFGAIASTKMMCQDMKIEDEYLKIFGKKAIYTVEERTLVFRNTKGDEIAKYEAQK